MAKLPQLRKLLLEDFKTQKAWIQPLLLVVNNFMEAVVSSLNRNLTIAENTTGQVDTVTLDGTWPVSFAWKGMRTPIALLIGNVQRADGTSFTLGAAVQVQWAMSSDNKSVQLSGVTGITPSGTAQYFLTIISLTG